MLVKKLFFKSRLSEYEKLIKFAINNDYEIKSLNELKIKQFHKKTIYLRHDIDHDPESALKVSEILNKFASKSSFYFRWETVNRHIMEQIHNSGHEVSLHYETFSNYLKLFKINAMPMNIYLDYPIENIIKLSKDMLNLEI